MKVTNQPQAIELTKEGLEELKAELKDLNEVKLPQVVERVAIAREKGDLSENSEYKAARDDKDIVDARIVEIEEILAKAVVVKSTKSKTSVGVGSIVTLHLKDNKSKKFTFRIVGDYEADPEDGKISSSSPVGRALINHQKGDEITVKAPAGEVIYIIDQIKQ